MRRVWVLMVCLSFSSFAAAQDSSQKSDAQTDAQAKQIISELYSAVQHNNVGDAVDSIGKVVASL